MFTPDGRPAVRLLMCPPTQLATADPDRAGAEWERLRSVLEALGATVELERPRPGLTCQAFAGAAGYALADRAVAATFRQAARRAEEEAHEAWFADHGYAVHRCEWPLEGAADLCGAGHGLLAGYGPGSDRRALEEAAAWLGVDVVPVRMAEPALPRLDLVVAPLDDRAALVAPRGLTREGARAVAAHFPDVIELRPDEARGLGANCLVVGRTVVLHRCTRRLRRELAARGLEALECPVDELVRAGGGPRRLALRLDGGPAAPAPPRPAAVSALR